MKTFLRLLRTAPLVHPDPGMWDQLSRIKYCIRGLLTARHTREWFEILDDPKLAIIAEDHPHIFSKLQRCYLHRNCGLGCRLKALKNHYGFVVSQLSHDAVESIFSSSGLLLTRIPLGKTGDLELRLGYFDSLSKEGEMSIGVHEADTGSLLAALSFCVTQFDPGASQIFVGGLQGFTTQNQKGRVIEITRGLYGLRPKALLLFALQQLAEVWEINSIRAVGDAGHVYRHYTKRKKVAMSYDDFWTESGGQLDGDGHFNVPRVFVPRDLSEMTSSKRQMYRRRYAMLQGLAAQIQGTVKRHAVPTRLVDAVSSVEIPESSLRMNNPGPNSSCGIGVGLRRKEEARPELTSA